jgi:hypothetical protein
MMLVQVRVLKSKRSSFRVDCDDGVIEDRLMRFHNPVHAFNKGSRVELSPHNLVRAVREDGDAPIADNRDKLLSGLDLRAHWRKEYRFLPQKSDTPSA